MTDVKIIKGGIWYFFGTERFELVEGSVVSLIDDKAFELVKYGRAILIDKKKEVVSKPVDDKPDYIAKKGKRGWWTISLKGYDEPFKVRAKSEEEALKLAWEEAE